MKRTRTMPVGITVGLILHVLIIMCSLERGCVGSQGVNRLDATQHASKGGEYVLNFGRYRGHKLKDIPSAYCEWRPCVCVCVCVYVCMYVYTHIVLSMYTRDIS